MAGSRSRRHRGSPKRQHLCGARIGRRGDRRESGHRSTLLKSAGRRHQRRPGGDHVVDDEHLQAVDPRPSQETRGAVQALGTGATGLRRRSVAFEEAAAGHAELTSDRPCQQLSLVKPALASTTGAGGRPRDDVEAVVSALRYQTIDDQPGKVPTDRTTIAILQPEDDAACPPGEGDRCDHAMSLFARRGPHQSESTRRADGGPGLVTSGAMGLEDHETI